MIQAIQVIHLIQVMQVRLAHLSSDFPVIFDGSPIQPPDKLLYAGYGLIMGLFEQEPRLLEVALEHYPNE